LLDECFGQLRLKRSNVHEGPVFLQNGVLPRSRTAWFCSGDRDGNDIVEKKIRDADKVP
jgi:hypothetical protein